jgi:pimeloyl-ACP methyl ester carboxylesterase
MEQSTRRRNSRITHSLAAAGFSFADKTDSEQADLATELFCTPRRTERTTQEEELVKSAAIGFLSSGLKTYTWGAKGTKVLFMHGWNGRGTQLSAFIEPLLAKGCQVVTFDGPAHGDSPGNQAHGIMFAQAIIQAQQELGPFHSVLGHSVGATAIVIAMRRGLNIPKAVLLSPASIIGVMHRFAAELQFSAATTEKFIEKVALKAHAHAEEREISLLVPYLNADILVFHDHADTEIPISDSIEFVAAYPRAELVQTNGHGHRRIIRASEVLLPAVDFLSE